MTDAAQPDKQGGVAHVLTDEVALLEPVGPYAQALGVGGRRLVRVARVRRYLVPPGTADKDQANMKSELCRTVKSARPTRVTLLVASNSILVSVPVPAITMSVILWKP